MLGAVNHPHVEHLALAMHERGFEVIVGGDEVPDLPPSTLPLELRAAPSRARGSLVGAAAHVRWIRGLLRELRPDVVHAHWLPGFAFFAAMAGAKPLVAMAWGSDVLRARRAQTLANRVALRRAAVAMADSQALLDRLVALGADRSRCVLVNWGVDLELFRPADRGALRAELGLGDGPVVLSPRSLMPVYNPRVIVDAWAQVAAERDDVQLVLKHMGVVHEVLGELPFPERVHVVGHVDYERMPAYYAAADACVSIASSDSAPRSVFEAMACGAPCVLSDLPWVHEQIGDGREALVVPIGAGAVAGALRRLLSEPALADGIAAARPRAGRARARPRGADGPPGRDLPRLGAAVDVAAGPRSALGQEVALARRGRQLLVIGDAGHLEPAGPQPVDHVGGVDAHVVGLPERLLARLGLRYRGVLVGGGQGPVHRDLHEREPTGDQHPRELARDLHVLGDVLEHVAAQDQIERAVLVRQRPRVDRAVHQRPGLEVGGLVGEPVDRAQPRRQRRLRRQVQHPLPRQPHLVPQVQPQHPLPLARAAARAHQAPLPRDEPSPPSVAAGAFVPAAPQDDPQHSEQRRPQPCSSHDGNGRLAR